MSYSNPRRRLVTAGTFLAAAALAAASLALPFSPVYDAWAWLVWGREVAGLGLDTSAGPSWKPLPVLVTTALAPAGEAAPALWLWLTRLAWLLAPVLAWRASASLARTSGGSYAVAAGAIAAAGVILLSDPITAWPRQFAGGLSEPVLVALVLGAVDRHLAGRRGQALALGAGAALVRPESWLLLAAYAVVLWRREPSLRPGTAVAVALVPVMWFIPDLLASGDALTGADRARGSTGSAGGEALEALGRAAALPLAALWAGAAWAVLSARARGERDLLALAAGALIWIATVAVLAAAGYAGLPRFAAPAGALVCVLGGAGIARLASRARPERGPLPVKAAAAAIAAALALQVTWRAADLPDDLEHAADLSAGTREVRSVAERASEAVRCDRIVITDFLVQTAVAWQLERPISAIEHRERSLPAGSLALLGPSAPSRLRALAGRDGELLARDGEWSAYAVSCPARASSDRGSRTAGVTGARR